MSRTAASLGLEPYIEGGYLRQTYESAGTVTTPSGRRSLLNTVYYLLTQDSPIGYLHRNRSDITHFHHAGGPVVYLLVSPDGVLSRITMGRDASAGEVLSFTAPGGWWKTSHLPPGVDECLIGEATAPGFAFADLEIAAADDIAAQLPHLFDELRPYVRP